LRLGVLVANPPQADAIKCTEFAIKTRNEQKTMKLRQRESINNYTLLQSLLLAAPLLILLGVFYLYPLISLFTDIFFVSPYMVLFS
jgi:hypothetical protein